MYIDLVLCEQCGRNFLFQAPAWSGLKKGDSVVVDTKFGERPADVVAVMTIDGENEEAMNFMRAATGAHLPLRKVIRKAVFIELKYAELLRTENDDDAEGNEK